MRRHIRNHAVSKITRVLFWCAASAACVPAHAADFSLGDGIRGQIQGAVTWGAQFRAESASPEVYADWPSRAVPGAARGQLQGQTGGSDLNFAKGDPVSHVLKAVLDLDLAKDGVGLFLRGHAWHDWALGHRNAAYGHYPNGFVPNQALSDRGFASSAQFSQIELRDAFVHGQFKGPGDTALAVRAGRQVLNWGGAVLHTGGIQAGIHPSDFPTQQRPGAMPSDGPLPVGMLSAQWETSTPWRWEGFVAYESRQAVLPGCGTFFDVSSIAPQGCDFAALSGASEQALLNSGTYLHRNPDVKAKDAGQYGVQLGYKAPNGETDLKLYAMNTHSALPSLRMTILSATPGVRSVNYGLVYPEDVSLWGMSFLKKVASTTRVFGELAYRPDQVVNLNAYDVLSGFVGRSPAALLALHKGIGAIPVGGTFDAYDRFGVVTGTLGVDSVFPKRMGAERLIWLGELGFSQVRGLPDTSVLRYGRPLPYNGAAYVGGAPCVDAVVGKTCTRDGYISRRAWGLKMRVMATYPQAIAGITLTPSILLAKDVKGYAHDGAFSEGRTLLRPTLRADMGKNYFAEIQYNRFSGGRYNLLSDRDYLAVLAGARF